MLLRMLLCVILCFVDTGMFEKVECSDVKPVARNGHTMVLVDNIIYVVCGYSGKKYLNDIWAFNLGVQHLETIFGAIPLVAVTSETLRTKVGQGGDISRMKNECLLPLFFYSALHLLFKVCGPTWHRS